MYWPAGGRGSAASFGGVHVTLLHEDVRAAYTVRHMRVRSAGRPATNVSATSHVYLRGIVRHIFVPTSPRPKESYCGVRTM